jgi:hypothetical protein
MHLLSLAANPRYGETKRGSSAKVQGSWISFFPLFFTNFEFSTNDWNGDYYWRTKHDESCMGIGSAIASELTSVDTTGVFKISRGTLDRLIAYYTEAGLMVSGTLGESPFTEAAQRVARRHHIAGEASAFTIIDGEVSVSTSAPGDEYEKIPF